MTVEVRLLGRVAVLRDGQPVPLGPRKQRLVFAILALEVGHAISVRRLVDLVWPQQPPPTAEHAVRVCVSGLRAALADAAAIVTQGSGYLLDVDPSIVDVHRFRVALAQARATADDADRLRLLEGALALWTGAPLSGTAQPEAQERLCSGLDEARMTAVEDRVDALLRLDRHAEVLDELADLTATHPLRERLAQQQMLALFGSGRRADALAAYRRVRRDLADHLGLDPAPELQSLQVTILREEQPAVPAPALVPAQLPPAVAGFAGRARELAIVTELTALGSLSGPVVGIVGTAGVGKTALAVYWAHRNRGRFPDGQLYVDLHGYGSSPPLHPEHVLGGFLRALGVAAHLIPLEAAEAAALYRSLLADRAVLVLLDNAAGVDQVRPLLPAGPGCATLVTSRDRLTGLTVHGGARLLSLRTLGAEESMQLLSASLGPRRLRSERHSAQELAELCGHLPLALRIAAAQLGRHPERPIAELVERLHTGDRLTALQVEGDDESGVRTAFDLSYVALKQEARRLFRMVGLAPGEDVSIPAAAALVGQAPGPEIDRALTQLTDAHLLAEPTPGRYQLHDLIRGYARGLSEAEDSDAERSAAMRRLYDLCLGAADAAARLLNPQMQRLPQGVPADPALFVDATSALAWLEAEEANLLAAIAQAAADGPRSYAWLLADALRGYFWNSRHRRELLAAGAAAVPASTVDGDDLGQAGAHLCLAQAHTFLTRYDAAIDELRLVLTHARRAGWTAGRAAATGSLANLCNEQGRLAEAAGYYREALALFQRCGEHGGAAVSLANLGRTEWMAGKLDDGERTLHRALELYREVGAHHAQALPLNTLGCIYREQGREEMAIDHLGRALELRRESGNRTGEADSLCDLAEAHLQTDRPDEAERLARAGLAVADEIGDRRMQCEACRVLAAAGRLRGDLGIALSWADQALAVARLGGYRRGEAMTLVELARIALAGGDHGRALEHGLAAREAAADAGVGIIEARVLAVLAEVEAATGPRVPPPRTSGRDARAVGR
ncbi:MAG TPA: BTAD domain-containing putative transcriptional regulator [Micromonosporaceae bacterium]